MSGKPGRSGGKNRKSQLIKKLEGNRSKVAQAQLDKPEAAAIGLPRLPLHLSEAERRLWADTVASLPKGLLSRADEGILERFAVSWATFREAHRMIASTGLMVQGGKGPVRNPLLVVRNHAAMQMHAAGGEIGLSPVARSRLTGAENPDADPLALLLGDDMDPNGAWSTVPQTRN